MSVDDEVEIRTHSKVYCRFKGCVECSVHNVYHKNKEFFSENWQSTIFCYSSSINYQPRRKDFSKIVIITRG